MAGMLFIPNNNLIFIDSRNLACIIMIKYFLMINVFDIVSKPLCYVILPTVKRVVPGNGLPKTHRGRR